MPRKNSIQPAQRDLTYITTTSSGSSTFYVDLAADLSRINRRAYRQGMQYYVQKVEFLSAGTTTVYVAAQTAGDTWTVHNSFVKGKAFWMKQQRDARKITGPGAKPKFEDFKIYLDDGHRAGTTVAATAADGGAVGTGDWLYSQLVYITDGDAATQEWYMHLIGGDVSTTDKSLILGYQSSRVTVQDDDPNVPNEASTNMYALLQTDDTLASDEVMQNMESGNDDAPYDVDDYVGNDSNCDAPWLQAWAIANSQSTLGLLPGFMAECGLIKFQVSTNAFYDAIDTSTNPDTITQHTNTRDIPVAIKVTLAPGPYKGVMASPMGQ